MKEIAIPSFANFKSKLRRYADNDSLDKAEKSNNNSQQVSTQLIQAISSSGQELAEHMSWYGIWVGEQVLCARACLAAVLNGYTYDEDDPWQPALLNLWEKVADFLRAESDARIDMIVNRLVEEKVLDTQRPKNGLFQARQLVFAVIGWQTMLWKAEFGVCPPGQLAIADEMRGFQGQAGINLRQDQSSCKKPLQQQLMVFGTLLPSRQFTACNMADGNQTAPPPPTTTSPISLNAYLLSMISGVTFEWTDILAHHLELDTRERVLYLYRFPLFCLVNIPNISSDKPGRENLSPLYACCDSELGTSNRFWAKHSDVRDLLRETLLSYRLLFGQSKPARRLYDSLQPFGMDAKERQDSLLHELCGRKRCGLTAHEERETYDVSRDFAIYQNKIAVVHNFLSATRPTTWKELWKDKRDSAQWLTFWLVLIFGGLGVILTFAQVVLQVVQLGVNTSEPDLDVKPPFQTSSE